MPLIDGAPAPWFHAPTPSHPNFAFSSLGGRYVLLAFLPDAGPQREAALALLAPHRRVLNDSDAVFFGVVREGAAATALKDQAPGVRWFLDADGATARLYGYEDEKGRRDFGWLLLDPNLRAMASASRLWRQCRRAGAGATSTTERFSPNRKAR